MSIAHRQPLNVRMQCTTPTVMHSGRRYKASRPLPSHLTFSPPAGCMLTKAQPIIQRPNLPNTNFQNVISIVDDKLAAVTGQTNSGTTSDVTQLLRKDFGCGLQQYQNEW